jgi:undecaprenyl pyrophosphate phosphatase UppP
MGHPARICSIDLPLMGQQLLSLGNMEAPQQAMPGEYQRGRVMVFISLGTLCSIVIGALCALLHCKVRATLAVSALVAVGAVVGGVILHAHSWIVTAEGIGFMSQLV